MEAWERFLTAQEELFGKESVAKWLRSLKVVDFDACNLYLEAKDAFQISWFEEQIRSKLQKELLNNNHRPIRVHLTAATTTSVVKKVKKEEAPPAPPIQIQPDVIDPNATFERYIHGAGNIVVYRLLKQLAEGTESLGSFNPIYLHGPSGTGKTHLLMAVAQMLQKRGISTFFVRAETFTEHVVDAIRGGAMREFRQAYRNSDVLLIDDVDVFGRKSATQEELFHTFNALHTSGRQILLSGNKAPQYLEAIEPRLISRFEWGIILPLEKLDPKELEEMVRQRSASLNLSLDEKVVLFLVEQFQNSTKALHRALEALVLRSHMNLKETGNLGVDDARIILADLIQEQERSALSPEKIIHAAAEFYGIRTSDILGKAQNQECSLPRQVAMYLCRMQLKMPFIKLGSLFGRDHSTIMAGVKQIQKRIEANDREVRTSLAEILKRL